MVEEVRRRLAAILAADVVGYSRLMEADEPGTLAALTAHREELIELKTAEHEGRIVKLMGEDEAGTLAALGAHREAPIEPKIAEHEGGDIGIEARSR